MPRTVLRTAAGLLAAAVLVLSAPARAQVETAAREAILIDMTTGTVLMEKNADARMPPSSMSKIMTMYMVFERLKAGEWRMDTTLPVSERAWRMQGSKMFVELNNQIAVEDLIRGVIVQSGNDACIVLAEAHSGTEQAFSRAMTRRAREIGLTGTNLVNATGWPDEAHYMTARDLAILAQRLILDFPEYYRFYSETEFTYHGIRQGNRNPLLYRGMGADGIKTGHTSVAGYGLTASAERDGRRLILVVNGLDSMQQRADESARLVEWGFREFVMVDMFRPGDVVDEAPVWLGERETVRLTVVDPAAVTLRRSQRQDLQVRLVLDGPVRAPVAAGTPVGRLVVSAPGMPAREVTVVAAEDVPALGFFGRIAAAARHMVVQALN
jgi:D-alanyl-D-alanine carboxypeptidase (penicillin-binding protein 5/6)